MALVSLTLALGLTGCNQALSPAGGGSGGGAPAGNLTGNWEFQFGSSAPVPNTAPGMGVYMTDTGGSISSSNLSQQAVPQYCAGGCCGGPQASFIAAPFTGSVDASGHLTLQAPSDDKQDIFTISATANSDGTLSNGTYSITGACYASQGAMAGALIAPLNGTYSGTLTSSRTGASFKASVTFSQGAAGLNSYGFPTLNITSATFTDTGCMSGAMPDPGSTSIEMNGNQFEAAMTATGTPGGALDLNGSIAPDGRTLSVLYVAIGCNNDTGTGTLTLQ